MSFIYAFERLQTWQEARLMVKKVYLFTAKFPDIEKYALVNQMRRAAISVISNLAEGSGRTSRKGQAHFYQISYSSCIELLNQVIISFDLEYIKEKDVIDIRQDIEKVTRLINS